MLPLFTRKHKLERDNTNRGDIPDTEPTTDLNPKPKNCSSKKRCCNNQVDIYLQDIEMHNAQLSQKRKQEKVWLNIARQLDIKQTLQKLIEPVLGTNPIA